MICLSLKKNRAKPIYTIPIVSPADWRGLCFALLAAGNTGVFVETGVMQYP
jgi:hypothetical protein